MAEETAGKIDASASVTYHHVGCIHGGEKHDGPCIPLVPAILGEVIHEETSRHFWRTMLYRCTGCQRQLSMFLEDGCEGPPGGTERRIQFPAGSPGALSGQVGVLRFTPAGRPIQPVPFTFSCICRIRSAYMAHIHWHADSNVDVTWRGESVPDFPHFAYDTREDPQACGIPVNHR